MTRYDNAAFRLVRACTGALLALLTLGACDDATGGDGAVELAIMFENTLPVIYWVEFRPEGASAPTKRFFLYANATHTITVPDAHTGYEARVEVSLSPTAPGAARQEWTNSCRLGAEGYTARTVKVRVEPDGSLPSVACVDW
jgi:hypothetical protein